MYILPGNFSGREISRPVQRGPIMMSWLLPACPVYHTGGGLVYRVAKSYQGLSVDNPGEIVEYLDKGVRHVVT